MKIVHDFIEDFELRRAILQVREETNFILQVIYEFQCVQSNVNVDLQCNNVKTENVYRE